MATGHPSPSNLPPLPFSEPPRLCQLAMCELCDGPGSRWCKPLPKCHRKRGTRTRSPGDNRRSLLVLARLVGPVFTDAKISGVTEALPEAAWFICHVALRSDPAMPPRCISSTVPMPTVAFFLSSACAAQRACASSRWTASLRRLGAAARHTAVSIDQGVSIALGLHEIRGGSTSTTAGT